MLHLVLLGHLYTCGGGGDGDMVCCTVVAGRAVTSDASDGDALREPDGDHHLHHDQPGGQEEVPYARAPGRSRSYFGDGMDECT